MTAVSLSSFSTCVLLAGTAQIACWGQNANGHLATGSQANRFPFNNNFTTPINADLSWNNLDGRPEGGTAQDAVCLLSSVGRVFCSGASVNYGTSQVSAQPSVVATERPPGPVYSSLMEAPFASLGLPTTGWSALSVGSGGFACACHPAAGTYCWGSGNERGQLGGRIVNQVLVSNVLCPAGTFAPPSPAASCNQCPGGHFCPTGTSSWAQLNCGRGNYCPDGSISPTPCPFQVPPSGGWGALQVQGPAFLLETAKCLNHCFWNYTSGNGMLSKC